MCGRPFSVVRERSAAPTAGRAGVCLLTEVCGRALVELARASWACPSRRHGVWRLRVLLAQVGGLLHVVGEQSPLREGRDASVPPGSGWSLVFWAVQ